MLQEAGNLEMVVKQQLGVAITREHGLTELVRTYMDNTDLYTKTQHNLRRAKNEKAIEELIEFALSVLPGGPPPRPSTKPLSPDAVPST
jgi:hypothetical protein